MSAITRPLETPRASRGSRGEPLSGWILTAFLGVMVLSVLISQRQVLARSFETELWELLFWSVLIVAVNLLPLTVGEITLTLDMPILIAVAALYEPPVAGIVALLAALDLREVERLVPLLRAVFNRLQVAACVMVASEVFHVLTEPSLTSISSVWGTAAAIVAFHTANVFLVVSYTWLRTHRWTPLIIGGVLQFLITYLGYGALAFILVRLFRDVGAWSVVTLVIPILVAREALLRAQRLQMLADQLVERERLLERLFDRIVDERRDERTRIGAELHDDVLQSLIRISQLGRFLRVEVGGSPAAARDAHEIVEASEQAIREVRQVVSDLSASPLGRGGLIPTLRSLSQDLQLDWRVPVTVDAPPDLELSGDEQLVLYQVAREAMVNALKHAHPNQVSVRIGERGTAVFLEVVDDGEGFDLSNVDTSHHFGLGLVRERVQRQNGKLDLTSEKGHGTRLSVYFPREVATERLAPLES